MEYLTHIHTHRQTQHRQQAVIFSPHAAPTISLTPHWEWPNVITFLYAMTRLSTVHQINSPSDSNLYSVCFFLPRSLKISRNDVKLSSLLLALRECRPQAAEQIIPLLWCCIPLFHWPACFQHTVHLPNTSQMDPVCKRVTYLREEFVTSLNSCGNAVCRLFWLII